MTQHQKPVEIDHDSPHVFSVIAFRHFLELAAIEYAKSAPALADWIDDIYIRLGEDLLSVTVAELMAFGKLWSEDGWMHPNYAQNTIYKMRDRLGMENGVISF